MFAPCRANTPTEVDVLVVGGGASGVTAGIQSARMGVRTLIVEETPWLGGMLTAAGVSAIDGNNRLPAGLWGEFKERLVAHYGSADSLKTGWVSDTAFEPSVGNRILWKMCGEEDKLDVWPGATLTALTRRHGVWTATVATGHKRAKTVRAKIVIDATELGDAAKMCGAVYDVSRVVQDLTYVATLKEYGKDVAIPRPEGYRPEEFACACENPYCETPRDSARMWSKRMMIAYGKLPNRKYMINWPIEGNDYHADLIERSREAREEILKEAKARTMRFVYFIQHELGYRTLGLADDEYPTADRLPFIPYYRESRRVRGLTRFGIDDILRPYERPEKLYRTAIAVGDYPIDHHHSRYEGNEDVPHFYYRSIPSYGLPLGTLIPEGVEGLIVAEKSISVSDTVNGTTRLQPVVMQIGQAAGALAALAVKRGGTVARVAVRDVQDAILAAGGYLLPYLDVHPADRRFKAYQRIGATGILRGEGHGMDWSNQTWLRADSALRVSDLNGLTDVYPAIRIFPGKTPDHRVSLEEMRGLLKEIARMEGVPEEKEVAGSGEQPDRSITRGEAAMMIDHILDPFHRKQVDIRGNYIK
ncbi:MAG: FAD-dependent oxidoreductase [Mediterranea sp.]|nr:FAD-dependent oxidoreductase [Mediterranea sp.]